MAHSEATAVSTNRLARAVIYAALVLFAVYFLLPLFVMLVNSAKPLDEIRGGNMLALPEQFTVAPWQSAWGTAQIGVEPTGLKPYFWNSIKMVVPAVAISTLLGALSGYVLTKWRFRGANLVFGMMLLACFIPFQIVLIPMARILGLIGLAGTTSGLVLVHVVYGLGFTTLFFRNYYEAFPSELIKAAQIDGASAPKLYRRIIIPQLRPAFLSAFVVLAHMAIKSYDLVIALTGGGPGRATELPATFMYSYTFTRNQMGVGAASAVIMLMMIASIIIPYLYAELQGGLRAA